MKCKIALFILAVTTLLFGCGSPQKDITSLDQCAEGTIGVLTGSAHEFMVAKQYPKAKLLRIDMTADLLTALRSGTCQVAIVNQGTADSYLAENQDMRALDSSLPPARVSVGFRKSDTQLREEFDRFLDSIRADKTLAKINSRWLDPKKCPTTLSDIHINPNGPTIRVGTDGMSIPYSFQGKNEILGMDIELLKRFAAATGRNVEFKLINFGGLIPALLADKVDVIANYIMVTPEREEKIAFSHSYCEEPTAALIINKEGAKSTAKQSAQNSDPLVGKKIGVMLGSTQEAYVTKNYSDKATIVRFDTQVDLWLALSKGKCEVILDEESIAKQQLASNSAFKILNPNIYSAGIGVGFSPKQDALKQQFNQFLKQIKSDGTLDAIVRKWEIGADTAQMPALKTGTSGTPIRVGGSTATMPYDMIINGVRCGSDVEMMTRFANHIGRPIEFLNINFGGLIAALSSGRIDVIANCLAITDERKKNVNFSDPYLELSTIVAGLESSETSSGHNDKHPVFRTIDDLKDKRIAVMTGTLHDKYVSEHFPEAKIIRNETHADDLKCLLSGKCDASVFNETTFTVLQKENNRLQILDSALFKEDIGVGFRLDDEKLKQQFNEFLKECKKQGLIEQMRERWFNTEISQVEVPPIQTYTEGKPIKVGVTGVTPPFSMMINNEYSGMDVEMLRRFAEYVKRPVEFKSMNFIALIPSLASGQVDAIASCIAISPERAEKVNFSDPYSYVNVVVAIDQRNTAQGVPMAKENKPSLWQSIYDGFVNNLIKEDRYKLILSGLWQTILISIMAALLGTILGGVVCFMRMSRNKVMSNFALGYINIVRGIPILVLLMLLYYAVFAEWNLDATLVAIIAFAVNFAAYVSEMFRTSIEGVDRGQTEAGVALGFTKAQTFYHIVMPQAIQKVLPVYRGELISLIKMTSVVGYIAVEDLTKASDIIRSRTFDAFFPLVLVALIYFLLAWLFTILLNSLIKKSTK